MDIKNIIQISLLVGLSIGLSHQILTGKHGLTAQKQLNLEINEHQKMITSLTKEISTLKNDFNLGSEQISEIGKSIYILSILEQSDLLNYSILYGFYLKEKHPNNEDIINICDRQWYDYLLEK